MRITNNIGLLLLAMLLCMACNQEEKTIGEKQSFHEALEIHLNAIKNGKVEELRPTIANNVTMISPDGGKMDSREVFMEFHNNWFKQMNWEWGGDILRTEHSDSLGYALIQYEFIQKDSAGSISFEDNEYLVLIFKNSPEGWQLVHDQNTRIKTSENNER